ncbi:MAG TPA: type II secretion system F family protein [Propionibacteriaceae bacterium]|nr:type II secretion system F family protein [Propionibacteriaceae bacterium]
MIPLIPALAGGLIVAGILGIIYGAQRHPVVEAAPRRRGRLGTWWDTLGRRTQLGALVALVVGVLLAIGTGWFIMAVLLPLAVIGLPYILVQGESKRTIERIEAMGEWTRSLAGVLTSGAGLEQALIVSKRSAPKAIEPEVNRLVARLDARWSVEDALRAFATDLDDATGDQMVMQMMLGARRRGAQLASVLKSVADSTADDVSSRRQIEADRAKPRSTARWVTILSAGGLLMFGLTGTFLEPYHSPEGQLALVALLSVYVMLLIQMRNMSTSRPFPRLLTAKPERGTRTRDLTVPADGGAR